MDCQLVVNNMCITFTNQYLKLSLSKKEEKSKKRILEKWKSNKSKPRCVDYTLLPGI